LQRQRPPFLQNPCGPSVSENCRELPPQQSRINKWVKELALTTKDLAQREPKIPVKPPCGSLWRETFWIPVRKFKSSPRTFRICWRPSGSGRWREILTNFLLIETLSAVRAPIFFLTIVKCPIVAAQIGEPTGTIVAKKSTLWPELRHASALHWQIVSPFFGF